MIQVYADGELIYSPGLDGYELLELSATLNVEKAGTAVITMPPEHPAYHAYTSFRTEVAIYRSGVLLFRGRALYPTDDFYGRRKITCEGERCFLHDGTARPYSYDTGAADVFAAVIAEYNAQVDEFKRFRVGRVTVTGRVAIANEQATHTSDVVDELVKALGGYIVFSTDPDGVRVINWLASLDYVSGQAIEFGENLLDFSRTGANTELATVIVPYGARLEDGSYVGIAAVNNGLDYIEDAAAVALRGRISAPVYFDGVTDPAEVMALARRHLEGSKLIVTTLELSAVDLSALDRDIDTFQVGDWVRVRSLPHDVDEYFLLRERSYNLLNPAQDTVVFGKDLATLTGADVAANKQTQGELQRTAQSVNAGYSQVATALRTEMAETYAPKVNAAGQYMTGDGLLMQWGAVEITPTSVASAASAVLTYAYPYAEPPVVLLTPVTANPSGVSAGVSEPPAGDGEQLSDATTGATVTVKSNTTNPVTVYWYAIGRSA